MKCLLNPMTGDMRRVPEAEAKHLASYGWKYVPKATYKLWQVSKLHNSRMRGSYEVAGTITGRLPKVGTSERRF